MMQPMSCTKEVVLPVDRDEAWVAVSDASALEAWLAERVELELRPGGDASFTLAGGEERRGMVEEVTRRAAHVLVVAGGRRRLAGDVRARPGGGRHPRARDRDAGRPDRAGHAGRGVRPRVT